MYLYVVHGNTYYNGYGHVEAIFGVYCDKDIAEKARDKAVKELFEHEKCNPYTHIDDISDIEVEILKIKTDTYENIYLGGYCE